MDKKKLTYLICVAVFMILCFISIPLINNYTAYTVEKELLEIPLPENTELVESVSDAGKFVGNGNGMQFFGAILIRSELTVEELEQYYAKYRKGDFDCIVDKQTRQTVECIEHGAIRFSTVIDQDDYYIVYSWGNGIGFFEQLDFRGR